MNHTLLCIDAGNTLTKWAITNQTLIPNTPNYLQEFERGQCLTKSELPSIEKESVDRIIASNVDQEKTRKNLDQWAKNKFNRSIRWITPCKKQSGITNLYDPPESLGADRWASMIAVHHLYQANTLIITLGTASTIDYLTDEGVFKGGFIMPGLSMMQEALMTKTALPNFKPRNIQHLSLSTQQGLETGLLLPSIEAISSMVNKIQLSKQIELEKLILSGGASSYLAPALQALCEKSGIMMHQHLNLVLEGLFQIGQTS